jgi:hypothetical protein
MQTGMMPKPWPLWKAANEPNRISFDPLLYSVALQVSEKTSSRQFVNRRAGAIDPGPTVSYRVEHHLAR